MTDQHSDKFYTIRNYTDWKLKVIELYPDYSFMSTAKMTRAYNGLIELGYYDYSVSYGIIVKPIIPE